MSYDTLTMTAVAAELQELAGARVQRVIQPRREVIILSLYHAGRECGLLLSTHPRHSRIHLTGRRYRLPGQPPPFCMLLRKYLTGARISGISQPRLERMLELRFDAHEGLPAVTLMAEIMGRRSNIVLIDGTGIILGAAKTATREQNPRRAILSGLPYEKVPPQDKLDPVGTDGDTLASAMLPLLAQGNSPHRVLLETVGAVSPLAARELLYRSSWDSGEPRSSIGRLGSEMKALFGSGGMRGAWLYPGLNTYAPYPLGHLQEAAVRKFERMNDLLDHFYGDLEEKEKRAILQGQLGSKVKRRKKRLESKLEQLREDLQRAGEAKRYRIYGETLLTYGAMIGRGAKEAVLPHLYNPGETIFIPLDPSLNAGANAQKYFRIYRKISASREHLKKQMGKLQGELAYCRELLYTIDQGDGSSLMEIHDELVQAGYMKGAAPGQKKKERRSTPQPLSFTASSGNKILVGRNNRQNDRLTFGIAARRDTWLHAQGLPGSHVIIKGGVAPFAESDLLEAALLAAHYSKGRDLPAVAVDYTEVRHVRRAPGGKPGFVLYEPFQTIIVDPQDKELKQLLKKHSGITC